MPEDKTYKNRIPAESAQAQTITHWQLPGMHGGGNHFKSAKKTKKNVKASSEVIEAVAPGQKPKPMTAEQMQHMAEEAKQLGYAEGFAEGLKKGTDQGLAKGTEQGHSQAYQEAKQEITNTQHRLHGILSQLMDPMQNQDQQLENVVLDIVVNICRHVLDAELKQDPRAIFPVVSRAIAALPVGANNIALRINPADVTLLDTIVSSQQQPWTLLPDATVSMGGCIVKSDHSVVDFQVETRIQQYFDDLASGEAEAETATPVPDYGPLDMQTSEPEPDSTVVARPHASVGAETTVVKPDASTGSSSGTRLSPPASSDSSPSVPENTQTSSSVVQEPKDRSSSTLSNTDDDRVGVDHGDT